MAFSIFFHLSLAHFALAKKRPARALEQGAVKRENRNELSALIGAELYCFTFWCKLSCRAAWLLANITLAAAVAVVVVTAAVRVSSAFASA